MGCQNSKLIGNTKSSRLELNRFREEDMTTSTHRVTEYPQPLNLDKIVQNPAQFEKLYEITSQIRQQSRSYNLNIGLAKARHRLLKVDRIICIVHRTNQPHEMTQLTDYINIMGQLDHPNLVKCFEYFVEKRYFYIVQEYVPHGNILERVTKKNKPLSEDHAAILIKQLLAALSYIHQKGIIHRDVRPHNVLCDTLSQNSFIKLVGFNKSIYHPKVNQNLNIIVGRNPYVAPEVLKQKYNQRADVWSCGVILYQILSGQQPFKGKKYEHIEQSILRGVYSFHYDEWVGISQQAKDLVTRMLTFDPKKRITSEEALKHGWFNRTFKVERFISRSALISLKDFQSNMKIKEAIFHYVVSILSTKEDKINLLKTFKTLDVNGDGRLSKSELLQGYKFIMSELDAEITVENIFKRLDHNKNDYLDYSEFVMASIDRETMLSRANLIKVFNVMDMDQNGFITLKEFREVFSQNIVSDKVWQALMNANDKNKDGKISLKEFEQIMLNFEA